MASPPFACTRTAPPDVERRRTMIRGLRAIVQEVRELPHGYALRLPDEAPTRQLLELIEFERACCPFLAFELEFPAERGPIWLRVRGGPGVKTFMQAEATASGADG